MVKNLSKTAIVFRSVKYSYTQLLQYAEKYCKTFLLDGKTPEKVMIFADNGPEYFFAIYGAVKCNACVVPVDVQSTPKEIFQILEECRPEIIFVSDSYKEKIKAIVHTILDYHCLLLAASDIEIADIEKMPIVEIPMRQDDHIMAIIYTSGTT